MQKTSSLLGFTAAVCLTAGSLLVPSDADAAAVITIAPDPGGVLMTISGSLEFGPNNSATNSGPGLAPYAAGVGDDFGEHGYSATVSGGPLGLGCLDDFDVRGPCQPGGGDVLQGDMLISASANTFAGMEFSEQGTVVISQSLYNMVLGGGTIDFDAMPEIDRPSILWAGQSYDDLGLGVGGQSLTFTLDALIGQGDTLTINVAPVPIPAAAWLFGSALLGLAAAKRKKA